MKTTSISVKHDAAWSAAEAVTSAVFSIVTSFVIARIVGPAEFGAGTAITAVYVVLWVSVQALFTDAVVQRATIDDRTTSTAFWMASATGCLATLFQAASGWTLVGVFNDSRLLTMGFALAIPLPLTGVAAILQGLLIRERSYRQLALRTLVGQGIGTATGVLAAVHGAGAWAIVIQQAVSTACSGFVLLWFCRWRPVLCVDRRAARDFLSVGLPLMATTLVSIMRYRLFTVLIGGSAGAAVLGQVHIAFRLVETVRELAFTALWRLMLPVLSKCQNDRAAMLAQLDRWSPRCLAVTMPLCAALGFGLAPIVTIAMGPAWGATGEATWPLIALMSWSCLVFPNGVALAAMGMTRFTLYGNAASLICITCLVLLIHPSGPAKAVTVWAIGQLCVSPVTLWANARALRVGVPRLLTAGLTPGRHAPNSAL